METKKKLRHDDGVENAGAEIAGMKGEKKLSEQRSACTVNAALCEVRSC